MLERDFQSELIKELKDTFKDAIVLKNDPNYIQGFPDLTIFCGTKYAILEVKKNSCAHHQPNQDYYISYFTDMGVLAEFIYPENKEYIIKLLKEYFGR